MSEHTTTSAPLRLSIHKRVTAPPVMLTPAQRSTLLAIADHLIPEVGENPGASAMPDIQTWFDLAIAARADATSILIRVLDAAGSIPPEALDAHLRELATADTEDFELVSTIVAGAYFMVPENAARAGYPGQRRSVPGPTEAADDLDDDILDHVINRGPIYLSVLGE